MCFTHRILRPHQINTFMNQGQKQPFATPFKPPGRSQLNPAVPFPNESSIWEVYINEAVVVDNELVKDWTSSLNFLLVFAAIFSSVLSAFIIESKQMLEQDPADVMVDALIFFINNTANGTHIPYSRASFSPPSFAVSVNCLFFASLSASIVAALASVVSLQWVAEYDAAVSRSGSSPEDRVKRRQFRYGGMEEWKMKEIIAALPIFLYCSLVLFFAGLAQWMWNVHTTVGGVVLGGALLGGVFYLVTALLAVVFPSSPFRAPIVRWIYITLHLLFHSFIRTRPYSEESNQPTGEDSSGPPFFKRFTSRLTQAWNTATNIHTYRTLILYTPSIFTQATIQARDQAHINIEKKSLVSDSLAWLAENISISTDSHDRLLLLADEASRLDADQQSSKKFKEIPWGEIFHLLGSKYVRDAASRDLVGEDERGLVILLRCLRNPRIGPLIAPGKDEEYLDVQTDRDIIKEEDFEGIDPVYLLLRNIKSPNETLSIDQQVSLRVGCLNQVRHLSRSSRKLVTLQWAMTSRDSTDMWDEFIPLLCQEIKLHAHENEQKRVDTLISLVCFQRPPLETIPFRAGDRWFPRIISRPSIFFYRLGSANWVRFHADKPFIHSILEALLAAQRRRPQINLLWRFVASDEEINEALALSSPQDRFSLSDYIQKERQEMYLEDTLKGFDQLVAKGCSEGQRAVITELLCNDLAKVGPGSYKLYYSVEDAQSLRDPWIRLIWYAAAGINGQIASSSITDLDIPTSMKRAFSKYFLSDQPFIYPSILPRLRMRFWRSLDVDSTWLSMEEALKDTNKLKRLETEFTQPSLGVDHGGDFLLEIFHSPFSITSSGGSMWSKSYYGRVPNMLLQDSGDVSVFKEYQTSNAAINRGSISYLLQLTQDIKQNPVRLIRLLIQIAKADLEQALVFESSICVTDLRNTIEVVKKYCLGKGGTSHIGYSHELAIILTKWRDSLVGGWVSMPTPNYLSKETIEPDELTKRCTQVIHSLVAPRVTRFGFQASVSIACVRPVVAADAATGWLRMYT